MGRRWTWREAEAPLPRALLEAVADLVPVQAPLVARLLWNRDVRDGDAAAAFLRPTLAHGLRSPLLLKDMGRAVPQLAIDAETSLAAVTPAFAGGLAALEPHGPGNPEPVLLARDVEVQGVGLVGEPSRAHLKLRLRHDGRTLPAIGFGLGHLPLRAGERVDVAFTPRLSRWQGVERLRLEVLEVRGARPAEMWQPAESPRDSLVP